MFPRAEKCEFVPGDLVVIGANALMFPYTVERTNLDVDFAEEPCVGIIVSIYKTRTNALVFVNNLLYYVSINQISLVQKHEFA